jgi:Zn ribbon nucleic-acid-binding protein
MTTLHDHSHSTFLPQREDDSPPTHLPSRVYLTDRDDAEQVLTELELHHTQALEAWGDRERERFYQRATRYSEDDPRPEFPRIIGHSTSRTAPRYAVLPNGQRVRWVGTQWIETLCHIRETIPLAIAVARFAQKVGTGFCRGCGGHHLTPRSHAAPTPCSTPSIPAVTCPKCQADAAGSYVEDDRDTLKCLACGHHIYRSGPIVSPEPATLSEEEIARNEERINQTLFHEDEREVSADDKEIGQDWEYVEQQAETLDYASSHDIEVDTFDDSPEDEIDMGDLTDRLHAPAFALFTQGHVPLRQRLIELMLAGKDHAANRTLHWTFAGQLTGLPPSPQDESEHITQWINSLSTDDLLDLIGNPDTEHPVLAHPKADYFMPLDQLTQPLQSALYYQLRGFRDKRAGARILGLRHDLNPEALTQFLQRQGSTPPARAAVHTNRATDSSPASMSGTGHTEPHSDREPSLLHVHVDLVA